MAEDWEERLGSSFARLLRWDVYRYSGSSVRGTIAAVLFHRGLWAVLEYRLERRVLVASSIPSWVKGLSALLFLPLRLFTRIATGIELPATVDAGPGLHFPHGGPIVLHNATKVGAFCTICHGVTIGVSGRGKERGVPELQDRVYVGPNATIVGRLVVGRAALVGPNSLVTREVPPGTTVVGVPAAVVSNLGSNGYLINIPTSLGKDGVREG